MSLGALYARSSRTRGAIIGETSKISVLPGFYRAERIAGSAVVEHANDPCGVVVLPGVNF